MFNIAVEKKQIKTSCCFKQEENCLQAEKQSIPTLPSYFES